MKSSVSNFLVTFQGSVFFGKNILLVLNNLFYNITNVMWCCRRYMYTNGSISRVFPQGCVFICPQVSKLSSVVSTEQWPCSVQFTEKMTGSLNVQGRLETICDEECTVGLKVGLFGSFIIKTQEICIFAMGIYLC